LIAPDEDYFIFLSHNTPRVVMRVALLSVTATLFIALICLSAAPQPATSVYTTTGYAVGDTAEDFILKNVDGRMVSLADYPSAKGYVVVFTCNHCPYAQLYEQRLINLHKKYAPQGYPIIAINPNDPKIAEEDSYDEMQKRAREKKFPYVYLFDEQQEVYPRFGATRTPHVFLLDSAKVVRYIGAVDDNAETPGNVKKRYLDAAIQALINGEDPSPSTTKAIGCMIRKGKK
jgi:peroxiredoxin